jgi:hypothetical protein
MIITNSKTKGQEIFKDLCKIITAPSGQDARISEIDKLVAKNCAKYMIEKLADELDFVDERNDLLINIAKAIDDI